MLPRDSAWAHRRDLSRGRLGWLAPRAGARLGAAFLLVLLLGVEALPAGAGAAGARSRPQSGPCKPVAVKITGLPKSRPADVVLTGPSGYRHVFSSSGGVCLGGGNYALVSRPVRLGPARAAYPTAPSGPLPFERTAIQVPASPTPLPEVLAVSYFDQAPLSTFVLPRSAIEVPQGRNLPAAGGFEVHKTAATSMIRTGDIVVSPVARGLPHGLLGAVASVASAGTSVSLRTTPVSPIRAFSRAHLALRASAATPSVFSLEGLANPEALGRGPRRLEPLQATSFGCGQNFTVVGSASFQPSASLSLNWSWGPWYAPWKVEISGGFSLSPNASGSLVLSSDEGVHCQASVNLGTVPIGAPICTDFGCVTLQLVATASLTGTVGESFSQSLSEELAGSAGASFSFGARGTSFNPTDTLKLTGSSNATSGPFEGSVSLGIGPALQVQYGIPDVAGVGPEIGALDQVTLAGTQTGWSVTGGVTGFAGVVMSALGYSYSDTVSFPIAGPFPLCSSGCSGSWPEAPSVPRAVVATPDAANPQNSVDVTWQPPIWPGTCGGLTGYSIAAGSTTVAAGASATSATLSGLSAGTGYSVTVTAEAASCGSTPSFPATVTTANAEPPTAPCITSARGGQSTVPPGPDGLVTFVPPASSGPCATGGTGGSPITAYTISWAGNGVTGSYVATSSSDPGCFAGICSFPLPAYATSYAVTVSATNSAGTGPASDPATLVPLGRPSAPVITGASAGETVIGSYDGPGTTITWTPPNSDGGSPVTSYTINCASGNCVGLSVIEPASAGTTATIELGAYGTSYGLCVGATNAVGYSGCSASVTVTALTAPGVPAITAARGAARTPSLSLSWNPPGFDGGAAISEYAVDWAGNGTWGESIEPASSGTTASVTLPAFGAYEITVSAVTSAGQGPSSTAACITTGPSPPCAPTITSASGGGLCPSITGKVSWSPPSLDGGNAITSYRIVWTGTSAASSGSVNRPASYGTTDDFPLKGGPGKYSVVVSATNKVGTSLPSAPALFTAGCHRPPP